MLGFLSMVATLGRSALLLLLPAPALVAFLLALSVSWLQLLLLPSLVLLYSSTMVSSSESAGRHFDRCMVSELMVASGTI